MGQEIWGFICSLKIMKTCTFCSFNFFLVFNNFNVAYNFNNIMIRPFTLSPLLSFPLTSPSLFCFLLHFWNHVSLIYTVLRLHAAKYRELNKLKIRRPYFSRNLNKGDKWYSSGRTTFSPIYGELGSNHRSLKWW